MRPQTCSTAAATGAAPSPTAGVNASAGSNAAPFFTVRSYRIEGDATLLTNAPATDFFQKRVGTNINLADLTQTAAMLESHYESRGFSNAVVVIGEKLITNGVVTISVFRGGVAQIIISGKRQAISPEAVTPPSVAAAATSPAATTNTAAANPANKGPGFDVRAYEIRGNSILSVETMTQILTNYVGTNITVADIVKAASELQKEYRERFYPTVNVTLPPQQITNGLVNIRVFQGRVTEIDVVNNHYFSSNNVLRALPSVRSNMLLNSQTFQAELDRANANQDRQIYPRLEPGPAEGTTALRLRVEDRLPLHGKVEFDNQSSPGTPALRLNSSIVYNNLWQRENSLGAQFSFSPEWYKSGDQWNFFDKPLVVNYSAFYRLPLGGPAPIAREVETRPGTFGFNEATRKFNLPPPTGQAELNFFASRATIDTSVLTLSDEVIQDIPGFLSISKQDQQEDLTVTGDIGTRLTIPIRDSPSFRSGFSLGADYKTYELTSNKTNTFIVSVTTLDENGATNPPTISTVTSPVPTTHRSLDYSPLSLRYDTTVRDSLGTTMFGLGLSGNAWFSGSVTNVEILSSSTEATGHWIILTPSLTRDFVFHKNWTLTIRTDGQWASQPLISNEQFSEGGVASVRGYQEGEEFGDCGWHISVEQKTPAHVVGLIGGKWPLTIRGSVYMDYAEALLKDPHGRDERVPLWGTGFGGVISAGTHWEARFLFSWPLISTANTSAGTPRFDFGLTAQF